MLDAAAKHGVRAARIPLHSFGSLADNARILCDWLARHSHDDVVLVSLSKGGTDLQHALSLPGAEAIFGNVSLWINVSGIVQGTALADWLLGQPIRSLFVRVLAWWRGYPFHVLQQIRRTEKLNDSNWPRHLRVVHLVGFPLHGTGTNHGLSVPIAGSNHGDPMTVAGFSWRTPRWPGTLIPLWGADHYLREESCDVARLVMRLLDLDRSEIGAGTRSTPGEIATTAAGG